jgi:ABC-type thiamin/hydroxymethylpyrimidine transport system permease subunit
MAESGPSAAQESAQLDGFGNKAAALPQSLIKLLALAEREGFEPSVGLTLRLISSQVHSTTLPPLRTEGQL